MLNPKTTCDCYFSSVHVAVEEKISVTAGRDGGLQGLELHGMVKLSINDAKSGRVALAIANNDKKGAQMQVSTVSRL